MPDFQCAAASNERGEPLYATASQVRRWLLVEVRGSWGRDSVADTALGREVSAAWRHRMRSDAIRVLAIRRDLSRTDDLPVTLFYVESAPHPHRPGWIWRRQVSGLPEVESATDLLPARLADASDADATSGRDAIGWLPHDEPVVLVCTNGRHDSCCAAFGRPIVRTLRQSAHADTVWECSHIGGDRFAGNIVVLPDGLYFGRCDPAEAIGILDEFRRGQIRLDNYRGRSTLGFSQQAAEHFVRRQLGDNAVAAISGVHRLGEATHGRFAVDVITGTGRVETVVVTIRRRTAAAPTPLTCTGAAGRDVPLYELVDLRRGPLDQ